MVSTIASTAAYCPKCGYCLYGLPKQGKCPECGGAYFGEEPSVDQGVQAFTRTIPKHWRLWLTPQETASGIPWVALATLILACAGSALLFSCARGLATLLATKYPSPLAPRDVIYTEFATLYGSGLRLSPARAVFGAVWISLGELFLATILWLSYALRAFRLKVHRGALRHLGVYAALSVPSLLVVPMTLITIWQILNVRFTYGFRARGLGLRWLRFSLHPFYFDALHIAVFLALIVTACTLGLWAHRRHRRCLQLVCRALSGIRPASDGPRILNGHNNEGGITGSWEQK